ncbi:hypothetical protein HF086_006695 [Spodoptera exigua]|uniref:Uncharacterized protein n=1 Tax=Spodoptera exigua TaxID=7107 RepID=A0A922MZ80_SPOEX|nr:hypothetical protein HF086_006695 [Spodoptera exigua]
MASESSSAVLELNDADAEDTEATTVTDDTHEGVPLIMEHGYDIAVKLHTLQGPILQMIYITGNDYMILLLYCDFLISLLVNLLEQASEALRSELSDWIPKTRSEIKALLLDLADRQVNQYTQAVHGWEQGLKLATETNIDEIFKTVSKTAVQNLSPSRCLSEMTPTETERDLDDYSEEFDPNSHDDFENHVLEDGSQNDEKINEENHVDGKLHVENATKSNDDVVNEILDDSKESEVCKALDSRTDGITDPLREFIDVDLS